MPTLVPLFVRRMSVQPDGAVIVVLLPPLTVIPATSTSSFAIELGLLITIVLAPEELFTPGFSEPNVIEPPPEGVVALLRSEEPLAPPPIVDALLAPLRSEEPPPAIVEALFAPLRSDELLGPAPIEPLLAPLRSEELLGPPPIEAGPLPLGYACPGHWYHQTDFRRLESPLIGDEAEVRKSLENGTTR